MPKDIKGFICSCGIEKQVSAIRTEVRMNIPARVMGDPFQFTAITSHEIDFFIAITVTRKSDPLVVIAPFWKIIIGVACQYSLVSSSFPVHDVELPVTMHIGLIEDFFGVS